MASRSAVVPMTVIGGFLGAGKTTLLNHVLGASRGVRYAVLVNDFGDLAVDGDQVSSHGGETVTFANGCVCCTLGDGLMETVDRLLGGATPPEQFIVEASGVSDPRAIADQATLHPGLSRDLTIVLADAETVMARCADPRLEDTVRRQLRAADLVVLNKCDRVDPDRGRELEDWLHDLSGAPVARTVNAQLPLELLRVPAGSPAAPGDRGPAAEPHHPERTFRSVTVPVRHPVDTDALLDILRGLPASVLRAKGFVRSAGPAGTHCLVQLTGGRATVTPQSPAQPAEPALVFIGLADLPDAGFFADAVAGASPDRGGRSESG